MFSAPNLKGAILGALTSLLFLAQPMAQESFARDPLALVQRVVDPAPIADLAAYQGKDADLSDLRAQIEKALIKANSIGLIEAKRSNAMIAVEFAHEMGVSRFSDYYFHLSAEPNWKVVASGRPPMPPWGPERQRLGDGSEEELRTWLMSQGASAEQIAEGLELRKTAPLYGPDREVMAFFEQNRARLNELRDKAMPLLKGAVETKDLIGKKPEATDRLAGATPDEVDRIATLLKETSAFWMGNALFDQQYAEEVSRKHPDWRYFHVAMWSFPGGALGFFWKSGNAELPSLSPNGYLIIRSLSGGWYLYRTAA